MRFDRKVTQNEQPFSFWYRKQIIFTVILHRLKSILKFVEILIKVPR